MKLSISPGVGLGCWSGNLHCRPHSLELEFPVVTCQPWTTCRLGWDLEAKTARQRGTKTTPLSQVGLAWPTAHLQPLSARDFAGRQPTCSPQLPQRDAQVPGNATSPLRASTSHPIHSPPLRDIATNPTTLKLDSDFVWLSRSPRTTPGRPTPIYPCQPPQSPLVLGRGSCLGSSSNVQNVHPAANPLQQSNAPPSPLEELQSPRPSHLEPKGRG